MNKTNIKKHFVFDVDDTLIDGRQFCGESMSRAIRKFEPSIDSEKIIRFHEVIRGATVVDLFKRASVEFNLKTPLDELLKADAEIQSTEFYQIKIFDGVIEILEFLHNQGKKVHICTNRIGKLLIPVLEHNKINHYFDTIISCIDEGHKKPDPTCLVDLMNQNGNNPAEFIYFGDSEVDSEFAKNSGIDFIIFDQYLNEKNLFKKLINLFLEDKINGDNTASSSSSPA